MTISGIVYNSCLLARSTARESSPRDGVSAVILVRPYMRWLFLDPKRRADVARRERFVRLIDRWWRDFAEQSPELVESLTEPEAQLFAERLQERLARIDERLCWEVGPGAAGKPHRLVVTPETDVALRPLTATLLERAPELPGWEFYSHRLAESAEMLPYTLEHRVGVVPGNLRAFLEPAPARKLAIRFASPDFEETDDDEEPIEIDCAAAFVAAETLLGEEFVDQWIGYVGVETAPDETRGAFEILFGRPAPHEGIDPANLRDACWRAAEALRDLSPETSYLQRHGEFVWTSIDAEPNPSLGLRGSRGAVAEVDAWARDVTTARTVDVELWSAFREPLFFSASWSRAGETFCRLQLSSPPEGSLAIDDLAAELDRDLVSQGLGCTIGVGMGERFGHVDLAILSLPAATEFLRAWGRRASSESRFGSSSWLFFHDAYLSGEWIGLAKDSKSPEGME